VQTFLPQIEASNAVLSQADPSSLDIENISESSKQYIEMVHVSVCFKLPSFIAHMFRPQNLGFGVFEDVNTASHSLTQIQRTKSLRP